MRRKTNNIKHQILKDVMREITPILEHDWTSAEASRMVDVYKDHYMSTNAKRWRTYADEFKEKEQAQEYDEVIDVKKTISFFDNKRRFVLAVYVPAKMNILMYFGAKNKMAVVRLTPDGTKEIFWKDIIQSIATLYKRGYIESKNCSSVSKSLSKHRREAMQLSREIKNVFGYDISWRYFSATGRRNTNNVKSVENVYRLVAINNDLLDSEIEQANIELIENDKIKDTPRGEYSRAVLGREFGMFILKDLDYNDEKSQYFIYLGNKKRAMMFRLQANRNYAIFKQSMHPGPPMQFLKKFDIVNNVNKFATATPETSNIKNLYNYFMLKPQQDVDDFFGYLSDILATNVSMESVLKSYNTETNNIEKNGGKMIDDGEEHTFDENGLVKLGTIFDTKEKESDPINSDADTLPNPDPDVEEESVEDFI